MSIPLRFLTHFTLSACLLFFCEKMNAEDAPPEPLLELHVSPDGNDKWSGKLAIPNADKTDGPFATIERASPEAISGRRSDKTGALTSPIVVWIHAGTYELKAPLNFGAGLGTTAQCTITYRAFGKDEVRISAGHKLTALQPVTDEKILAQLDPAAKGHVLQSDLKAQGITDFGDPTGGFGKSGLPGLEIFINDKPITLSRYPNEGFIKIKDVLGPTPTDPKGPPGRKEGIFSCDDERVARWVNEKDARVLGYWFHDWADQRQKIEKIDAVEKKLTLAPPFHGMGYRKNQYFYGFNMLCEIDQPGEWYLDRETGILYVWPPESKEAPTVVASVLPNVFNFKNSNFITLQGLIIENARATGIVMKDCNECNVIGCTIRNHGGGGINVDGGKKVTIKGCDVYGEGDGGVSITGGDRKTLTPGEHLVENCHIHHYSRWNRTYRPGISQNGVGNRSAHNLIHDAPHQGMAFGGNDQIIEFNEFHNVCEESNDAGVMYAWNDWAGRGNEVRFNYMHNNYGHESKGCSGVYVDDNFSSAHIHDNLFYHMYRAIQMGGGRDYKIENNIFVDCVPALDLDARGLGWRAYGKDELIKKLEKWPYKEEPWKSKYPELQNMLEDEPMAPKNTFVFHNIGLRGKWSNIDGKAKPYVELKDNWVSEDDPGFADLEKKNFNLKPDAEALKGGFKALPIEKMGLYESPDRASWPVEHPVTVRELKKPAPPAVKPHPSKPLNVALAKTAPTIDGEIKADEWSASPSPIAENTDRSKIKSAPAQLQVTHDDKTLYVAVTIPLPKPIKGLTHEWGKSDGMEICLRSLDGKPGPIAVIHGFMDGTKEATGDGAAPKPMIEALNKGVTFAAKVSDAQWTGEWAIPLEAAGIIYKPGAKIGFNLGIHRTEGNEWIQWTGTLGGTFKLENAGSLILE